MCSATAWSASRVSAKRSGSVMVHLPAGLYRPGPGLSAGHPVGESGPMADKERRKRHLEDRIRAERRAVLVVNTRSRRAAGLLPKAQALLRARGFTLDRTFAVHDPSTLDAVLAEAMSAQPPLLVLGSGDGTVASVVDHLAGTSTVLGYLPMGTTNNLARSLGLPLRL